MKNGNAHLRFQAGGESAMVVAIVVAVLSSIFATSSARSDTLLLLRPTDDALVASHWEWLDLNFGNDPQIIAWANYPSFGARSYVRFDLSGIPDGETVTFARLNLFQFNGGGFASGFHVFRVADDGWSESTLTWNNQPVPEPSIADLIVNDATLTGGERRWVSFDLLASGVWDPSVDLAAGDDALSVILRTNYGEVGTQRSHNFCSSEANDFQCLLSYETGPIPGRAPQLIIGTPEPDLAALMGSGVGLLAILGMGRRSRRRASWSRRPPL